jgi:hypothetical protein
MQTRSYGEGAAKEYTTEVVLGQFNAALQMLDSAPAAETPDGTPRQRGTPAEPGGRN